MSRRSGGLFIGRLAPESGVGVLLEALDLFQGARVDVIGNGPEMLRLQAHPRVRLLGGAAGNDPRERMASAGYLILPGLSYKGTEGEPPRALLEAFAHGVPVIASRVGPLTDFVEPGRNGLFFEPGSARDLARRMAWAEAFPEKMRQMGECAKADYQARFVEDWSYSRLFGERRKAARA